MISKIYQDNYAKTCDQSIKRYMKRNKVIFREQRLSDLLEKE